MVNLTQVKTLNAALLSEASRRGRPLVAVFLGGTSGIGHMTARTLASSSQQAGHAPRIYLVGRSEQRGEQIVEELRGLCPAGTYRFVRAADLSLLACVDAVCAEITRLEGREEEGPRIDYLMTSQGGAIFQPRKDTTEGLDATMALLYYSRMRAIQQLTPLLLQSVLPATVVSVFAAGFEDEKKLFLEDLSLRDLQRYSYIQVRSHLCYMHSMYMSKLAEMHAGDNKQLRLVHIFPGLVLTPAFHNPTYPAWFRFLFNRILAPFFLAPFVAVDIVESGERMISLASPALYPAAATSTSTTVSDNGSSSAESRKGGTVRGMDGRSGSGAYSLDWKGDDAHNRKVYAKYDADGIEALKQQVWEHTNKAFEVIATGKPFTE
ncbi:MFS transporter- sugar porter (SP) family protein [Apiospora marii]|uniref:MFS transporter- sugar porter (SP) family protein n=1 Tax=Apiospora marii TaxID=335849 RepID=UPI0031319202